MEITINSRHSWSLLDRVARIQREDLAGRMAIRVVKAINARLSEIVRPCTVDVVTLWDCYVARNKADTFPEWPTEENDTPEQRDKWSRLDNALRKYSEERDKLEQLKEYYEPRTYTTKELDDLTADELRAIDDINAELLPDRLQRVRKALLKE